jgi:hypothetical protein
MMRNCKVLGMDHYCLLCQVLGTSFVLEDRFTLRRRSKIIDEIVPVMFLPRFHLL